MDTKQARALRVGQRVFYQSRGEAPSWGTVSERLPMGFRVEWDDGKNNPNPYPNVHADAIHMPGFMGVTDPRAVAA